MSLKICTFNLENFFVFATDEYQDSYPTMKEADWQNQTYGTTRNKPIQKLRQIAAILDDIDADIYMFTEVGGPESLDNFQKYFWTSPYQSYVTPSNSDRGIDLAFCVKKELPFDIEFNNHRSTRFDFQGRKVGFSRDVLHLKIDVKNQPFLDLFLVHLKSHLSKGLHDPYGFERRKAELNELVNIYNKKSRKNAGAVIAGDFNGQAGRVNTSQEFLSLYDHTELEDILEVVKKPKYERYTHIYMGKKPTANLSQLDYIFLNPHLQKFAVEQSSGHYKFAPLLPYDKSIPSKRNIRRFMPSDHLPLIANLDIRLDESE